MGDQRIPAVAGGAAIGIGRRDVADGEDAPVTGHPQFRRHANEPALVE